MSHKETHTAVAESIVREIEAIEPDPKKRELWTTTGYVRPVGFWRKLFGRSPEKDLWYTLAESKEAAEANAARPHEFWTWDGLPARIVTLGDALAKAESWGMAGVAVANKRGLWVRRYPVRWLP